MKEQRQSKEYIDILVKMIDLESIIRDGCVTQRGEVMPFFENLKEALKQYNAKFGGVKYSAYLDMDTRVKEKEKKDEKSI